MFKALQKLQKMFGSRPEDEPDSRLLDGWAHSRGHQLKRVRRGEGRVIEFDCDDRRGRMEWGPSHRAYIKGRELRIRIDAGLPGQMEMMIMSRRLAQQLGGEAYQTLTSAHQTGIDADLPLAIGITRTDMAPHFRMDTIRHALAGRMPPVPVMTIDAREREQVSQLVRALLLMME